MLSSSLFRKNVYNWGDNDTAKYISFGVITYSIHIYTIIDMVTSII